MALTPIRATYRHGARYAPPVVDLVLVRPMKRFLFASTCLLAISTVAAQSPSAVPLASRKTKGVAKAVAIRIVRPRYPTDERGRHPTGRGIVLMEIDRDTGWVTSAKMEKSTGSKLLDDAAVEAFRQWRFKPGTVRRLRCPITFTFGQQPKV